MELCSHLAVTLLNVSYLFVYPIDPERLCSRAISLTQLSDFALTPVGPAYTTPLEPLDNCSQRSTDRAATGTGEPSPSLRQSPPETLGRPTATRRLAPPLRRRHLRHRRLCRGSSDDGRQAPPLHWEGGSSGQRKVVTLQSHHLVCLAPPLPIHSGLTVWVHGRRKRGGGGVPRSREISWGRSLKIMMFR